MTAELSGKLAAEGAWSAVRKVRDHWVLVVFVTAALVGARDVYDQYAALPQQVTALRDSVVLIRKDLEQRGTASANGPSGADIFPGSGHAVQDGLPGAYVSVRFAPVWPICQPGSLTTLMRDARGHWFAAQADVDRLPALPAPEAVSFRVQIHPEMAPGRADLQVQVTLDCDGQRQTVLAPRLPFRVLPNPAL